MGWIARLHSSLSGSKVDATLDEEVRFHLDERTEEFVRREMTLDEARQEAHRRFQLFGLGAADPVSFSLAAVTLAAVAVVTGLVPARRATRVDPLMAVRAE